MTEFVHQDLSGSGFRDSRLTGARFEDVDLNDTRFRLVSLHRATIRGAYASDLEITGEIQQLRVNGVDVIPWVEAELDRRYPDRPLMRASDPAALRAAWGALERLWDETVQRARRLPAEALHEQVDGEWSFIETLRHLVFATDTWISLAIGGEPSPWHPLALPHDDMPDDPTVPRDRAVRPSLDEVLLARADRQQRVRRLLADVSPERLAASTGPVHGPGFPEPETYVVLECVQTVLHEEWEHRMYADRDLAVLEARG